MSEGCPGCFQSVKGQQEELKRARREAHELANINQTTYAIYREGYEYRYIRADQSTGLQIVEFVSPNY